MNNWQLDILKDQADTKAWNELNAPDPYENVLKDAATDLEKAIRELEEVRDRLEDASAVLSDTPMQAKINSFSESLDEIFYALWTIQMRWERGERE